MKKRSIVSILLIIFVAVSLVFTGCSKSKAYPAPAAEAPRGATEDMNNEKAGATPDKASEQLSSRKLIVKLFWELRVDDIEKSIRDAEAMSAAVGGYTRESYQNESSGYVTIMVPAGKADTFMQNIQSLGKVMNSNRNTEDVTDSYFDTQIRIKNLEAEIETMRSLLQKPGWKVSEILEIEREIRRLTDELESLKGYITNLDRQITYSEVRISFQKSQTAVEPGSRDSISYKLKLALVSGINLLTDIVIGVLRLIVFVLPLSPILLAAYFLIRKVFRLSSKKAQQEPDQKQP